MSNNPNLQSDRFSTLLQIEQAVRRCESLDALAVRMVNETGMLVPSEQAAVFLPVGRRKVKALAIANQSQIDRSAPMIHWLERLATTLRKESEQPSGKSKQVVFFSRAGVDERFRNEWSEYLPENIAWVRLQSFSGTSGYLLLAAGTQWNQQHEVLLNHLAEVYGHALRLFRRSRYWVLFGTNSTPTRLTLFLCIALLLASYVIKVPLTTTAPAEIVPDHPHTVASPQNGVVKDVVVEPNQMITAGDLVVLLDDTELRNRVEVARMALNVAVEELERTRRSAFVSAESKALVAELRAQVDRYKAELQVARDRLEQTRLRANSGGTVIGAPRDQWEGKPVSTGTTILQVADPAEVQVRVFLPVDDAITLEEGSSMRVFLHSDPLNPLAAKLDWAGYSPEMSPMGFYAYRLQANLTGSTPPPRIGLRGTATLFGPKVSLLYTIFRKPLTFIRQHTGL